MNEPRTATVLGGRYRLEERLAAGGMGTVWAATDQVLNRRVAVKVLNEGLADDERFIERFRREAKAAAGLLHPNVAGVFDYGEEDGRPYIVMELIEGETLADRLARDGRFPPEEVARVGADVASALAVAHQAGILHRDVKPANIMLTNRGEVKVMDFGIAAEVLAGSTGLTGTGMVMGTAKYLSPEQATGRPSTPASDLYSLGAVLYEMLAGRAPFEAPSPMATALAHANDPAPALAELVPDVPPRLASVIERTLDKDPETRPASATVLAAELAGDTAAAPDDDTAVLPVPAATEALAAGKREVPQTSPDAAVTTPIRPRRRLDPKLLVAAAAIVAVVLLLVFLFRSSGSGPAAHMPKLVGKPGGIAARHLEKLGVHPKFSSRPSDQPKGVVIKQFPPPGTGVQVGDPAILVVSGGPGGGNQPSPPPPPPAKDHGKEKGKGKGKGHGKDKHGD
jgi:serine/threonine-protein kinase